MKKTNLFPLLVFVGIALNAQNLQISGGNNFSAAVCDNQTVYVWGTNDVGQLGITDTDVPVSGTYRNTPGAVTRGNISTTATGLTYGVLPAISQIDAGSGSHLMGLSCARQVWGWGNNGSGQLGRNNTTNSPIPQRVLRGAQAANINANDPSGIFLNNITYVSGGNNTSFAIEAGTGRVLAWGENDLGQLGDGTTTNRLTPVYVQRSAAEGGGALTNIIQIEGGDETTYALDANGFVWSWGRNNGNQLGRPGASPQTTAGRVVRTNPNCNGYGCATDGFLRNIVQLSGGDTHALALDASGFVWSFGGDWGQGQLGRGEGDVYQDHASRVIRPGRTTYCTGGCTDADFLGGTAEGAAIFVSAGQANSAVVLANGNVVTFGARGLYNGGATVTQAGTITCPGTGDLIASGTLGDGNSTGCNSGSCNGRATQFSRTPVFVTTNATGTRLTGIRSVSDGDAWYYAVSSTGSAFAWGWNRRGELGLGDFNDRCFAVPFTLPTGCSFSQPCPGKPTLGADITTCPVFNTVLQSQISKLPVSNTYTHNWRFSTTGAAGSYSNITPSDSVNKRVNQIGFYIVEVSDTRTTVPFLCGPCPTQRDTIRIIETPNPYTVTACEDVSASLAEFSVTAPATSKIKWYTNLTGGTALNPTDSNTTFRTSFANTNTSAGCSRALFAEDVSSVLGTLLPATNVTQLQTALGVGGEACNAASWPYEWIDATSQRGAMMIVVDRAITINQASLMKNDGNGTFGIKIFANNPTGGPFCGTCTPTGNKNGPGAIVYTSPAVASNAAAGTIIQVPMNYNLTPGIYWIGTYGNGAQVRNFNCNKVLTNAVDTRWTNQFIDNTGQNIVRGVNAFWDGGYSRRGSAFNIQFSAGTGYTCGRVRVCVSNTCILPVDFASFNVRAVNNQAQLDWSTASEKDAGVFEIQKSSDGVNFVTIGTVKAVGNSSSSQFYTFKSPLAGLKGMQYFRILEKSADGSTSTASDIRALFVEDSRSLRVIPNPNAGNFELNWIGEGEDEVVSYAISSSLGSVIQRGEIRTGEFKSIDMSAYAQGVYYISVYQTSGTYIEKIFVK